MKEKCNDVDVLKRVRKHAREGTVYLAKHAMVRKMERSVSYPDIKYVLETGYREPSKDILDIKRQNWKYAIRGKTKSNINIRTIVVLEEELIVITVIKLG